MKKTLLFLTAFLTFLGASAQNETIDETPFKVGLYMYIITSNVPAEVKVSGFADTTVDADKINITIPSSIFDDFTSTTFSVTAIGENAFNCDTGAGKGGTADNLVVETVNLPTSVISIGDHAFRRSANLTTINLDNIVQTGSNCFIVCSALTDIGSLTNLNILGRYSFYQCNGLTSIETPAVTEITEGNIYDMSGITTYNVPSTVTSIGGLFLGWNDNLVHVQVNWDATQLTALTHDDPKINFFRFRSGNSWATNTKKLYVPIGTKSDYLAHVQWGQFGTDNIIEGTAPVVLSTQTIDESYTSIYPNPTNGIVTINNSKQENMTITVYDINGSTLSTTTKSQVNISNLASGIYIFKIATKNGEVVKRVVKK